MNNVPQNFFTVIQLIVMGVVASQGYDADTFKWAAGIARYVVYLLIIQGLQGALVLVYNAYTSKKLSLSQHLEEHKSKYVVLAASLAVLALGGARGWAGGGDFLLLYAATLVCRLLMETKTPPTITYGVGMACSYFEGYLSLVIPSDGSRDNFGFVEKIRNLESSQGVVFPVKKLLLVITHRSLYCPPDMKEFNKPDRHDLPQLEACSSIEEVTKDVAGVKARSYKNTAYKISRPRGAPPVYVMTEMATPLRTLHCVLQKPKLYEELSQVDAQALMRDFCCQLQKILDRSPECRGRCELVYFDETKDYLPQVLLDTIKRLEADFEGIISRRAELTRGDCALHAAPGCSCPGSRRASLHESILKGLRYNSKEKNSL